MREKRHKKPCQVCSEPVFRQKDGTFTCNSCRMFFLRNRGTTVEFTACRTENCTNMTNYNKPCKGCRFRKCRKAGIRLKDTTSNLAQLRRSIRFNSRAQPHTTDNSEIDKLFGILTENHVTIPSSSGFYRVPDEKVRNLQNIVSSYFEDDVASTHRQDSDAFYYQEGPSCSTNEVPNKLPWNSQEGNMSFQYSSTARSSNHQCTLYDTVQNQCDMDNFNGGQLEDHNYDDSFDCMEKPQQQVEVATEPSKNLVLLDLDGDTTVIDHGTSSSGVASKAKPHTSEAASEIASPQSTDLFGSNEFLLNDNGEPSIDSDFYEFLDFLDGEQTQEGSSQSMNKFAALLLESETSDCGTSPSGMGPSSKSPTLDTVTFPQSTSSYGAKELTVNSTSEFLGANDIEEFFNSLTEEHVKMRKNLKSTILSEQFTHESQQQVEVATEPSENLAVLDKDEDDGLVEYVYITDDSSMEICEVYEVEEHILIPDDWIVVEEEYFPEDLGSVETMENLESHEVEEQEIESNRSNPLLLNPADISLNDICVDTQQSSAPISAPSDPKVNKKYKEENMLEKYAHLLQITDMDVGKLAKKVKKKLGHLQITQLVLAEKVVGKKARTMTELLNTVKQWSDVSPAAKESYIRMKVWMDAPDEHKKAIRKMDVEQVLEFFNLPPVGFLTDYINGESGRRRRMIF